MCSDGCEIFEAIFEKVPFLDVCKDACGSTVNPASRRVTVGKRRQVNHRDLTTDK